MTQVAKVIPLHAGTRRPAGGRASETVAPRPPERPASPGRPQQPHDSGGVLDGLRDALIAQVVETAEFVRRRMVGDYEVDDFGFDPHFADHVVQPVLRPLFEKWFRVEVRGAENIPSDGRALIVANHAGTLPLDALMTSVAVRERAGRPLRMLAADLAFDLPVVGTVARKAGHTLACHPDAERLLQEDQVVAVFPEGYKGLGKPFKERYKLQRFGRGGFVSAALRTHAPIVPCSIVGSEEIYPNIADLSSLARLLGLPYFPVTPLFPALGPLGLVPLPSKWYIEFGTPITTDVYDEVAADDPMVLFEVTDHVRETIQQTLYKLLTRRRNVFLG
ncbi:lysophospholipid acyltransferase family protein [Rhodococcus coprophilus]|uniref:Acyltransferase n=1 Tax=Rhodococcus coprophilus TaxID=38310 RepID=A0A2X4UE37_9NOCA|nr:lysophospholipid acyltransferase family protein [Rhodococcus coprophilus]MBM7459773.1 1-acyl-sn-glycerol-3-phosphate acyltransferase [Rhodococcus coprophilus]SQI37303.1 acyltransferase [Rhodococcus coprophilus]